MSQIQPLPDSANEGLLGHSQAHCFCIAYGYFHAMLAVVNSCDRDPMAHRAQYIYCLALYRKCLLTSGLGHRHISEIL